jgi:hypothetical protein
MSTQWLRRKSRVRFPEVWNHDAGVELTVLEPELGHYGGAEKTSRSRRLVRRQVIRQAVGKSQFKLYPVGTSLERSLVGDDFAPLVLVMGADSRRWYLSISIQSQHLQTWPNQNTLFSFLIGSALVATGVHLVTHTHRRCRLLFYMLVIIFVPKVQYVHLPYGLMFGRWR